MTYQVAVDRSVLKFLLKQDAPLVRRIRAAIGVLAEDPRPDGCRKLVGLDDCFRVRVGDYRILYQVLDAETQVLVYRVAHRKEAYR